MMGPFSMLLMFMLVSTNTMQAPQQYKEKMVPPRACLLATAVNQYMDNIDPVETKVQQYAFDNVNKAIRMFNRCANKLERHFDALKAVTTANEIPMANKKAEKIDSKSITSIETNVGSSKPICKTSMSIPVIPFEINVSFTRYLGNANVSDVNTNSSSPQATATFSKILASTKTVAPIVKNMSTTATLQGNVSITTAVPFETNVSMTDIKTNVSTSTPGIMMSTAIPSDLHENISRITYPQVNHTKNTTKTEEEEIRKEMSIEELMAKLPMMDEKIMAKLPRMDKEISQN